MIDIATLIKKLEEVKPKKKVAKNYINPYAANLLAMAGYEVKMQDGSIWKSEYDTNYGFAEFTRARHFQGLQAKEQVMLINDQSWFLNRYTKLGGDNPIIPMDYWGGIPEQLVDTQRISTTPQTDADVVATKSNWAGMFGDEIYVHHLERQVDLPIEVIRQYLYDPDFENRIEMVFQNEIGNDLTRLAVNGTDITYASKDFYKLLKGFFTLLKEAKGIKTLASGVTRFVGAYGHFVTPVKIDAPTLRFVTPFSDTFASDTAANYTASAGSLAVSSGVLAWTGTGWTGGNVVKNDIVPVVMNTDYVASVSLKMTAGTGTGYITVLDPAGNVIATSATIVLGTSAKTASVAFNSYANLGIRIKVVCAQSSGNNGFNIDNILVDRAVKKFQYFDVLNLLDAAIDNHNPEYELNAEPYAILMSKEDAAMLAKAQRLPLYISENGEAMPFGTETRDNKLEYGQTNLQHRGYPVLVVPYAKSLNNGGWIIFGPDTAEFRIGIQNIFSFNREYKSRMTNGGEGYEYTYHMYEAFGIRNPGKFVIIEGVGSTLKCEDLIIGSSKFNTGSRIGSSATAITYDLSDTAATGGYVFCDTPGAIIYRADSAAKLADIATAQAEGTLYNKESLNSFVTNGAHFFFRAFLPNCCQPSQILDVTGAT